MTDDKDVRVVIKVKNARILRKMEEMGIESVSELSRRVGVAPTALGTFVNMKSPARSENDQWRRTADKLSKFFHCLPEDLFSEQQQYTGLKKNTAHVDVSVEDLGLLIEQSNAETPEQLVLRDESMEILRNALLGLSPRAERVLSMRFGLDGKGERTLDTIAEEFSVGRERIRQIEAKAIRTLKHPARSKGLKDCAEEFGYVPHDVSRDEDAPKPRTHMPKIKFPDEQPRIASCEVCGGKVIVGERCVACQIQDSIAESELRDLNDFHNIESVKKMRNAFRFMFEKNKETKK